MVVPDMGQEDGRALNKMLCDWCLARIGRGEWAKDAVSMGVLIDGELVSVTVFDHLQRGFSGKPLNMEVSIAADTPRWASRGIIKVILHYPFCQLGLQRLTSLIPATNEKSLKLNRGLGFKEEGRVREALDGGEDLVITGMLREESRRWLGDWLDGK